MEENYGQDRPGKWVAKWIWQNENGPADQWMCFRKTFDIKNMPAKVIANVAVDSKYWMWINGNLTVFEGGLKRGPNRNDTYYDEIDIIHHLKKGANTIALLVWFFGKDGQYSHNNSGKGGLLFQADIEDKVLVSDNTWKLKAHPAYEKCESLPTPNFRLPESNVRFKSNLDICDWYRCDYDDSLWQPATEKGIPPAKPWNNLVPRPIPQWRDSGLLNYYSLFNQTDDVEIILPYTTIKTIKILGKHPEGHNLQVTPYLGITTQKQGVVIDIRTDLYEDGGNGAEFSVRAEYVTKMGNQSCELLGWMNGQRVEYTIPEGITINELKYRETGYDTEFAGSFDCSDSFINNFVKKAKRTLYVNMRDAYFDCPNRERAQWITDAAQSIAQAFHVLDRNADKLSKKAFDEITAWQNPVKKEICDFSPADPKEVDRNRFHIQVMEAMSFGVWTYYMYTGDLKSIKSWYPHIRNYIALWTIGSDGLVNHRTCEWDMVDNIGDKNHDMKVLENAWYYNCLKTVISMSQAIGNNSEINYFEMKKKSIEENFDKLWNVEYKAYKSPEVEIPDVRGNAIAVYSGLADRAKYEGIKKVLTGSGYASVNLQKFVYEALFIMGFEDEAFNGIMMRYSKMVNDTNHSNLWEDWSLGIGLSSNHAWAGGPMTLLYQYAAGVIPELPGFEKYHVLPQEGPLNFLNVTIPSVKGYINVNINKDDSVYSINLTSPNSTKGVLGIPKKFGRISCIFVNDMEVWGKGTYTDNTSGISWNGEDSNYYRFNINPGMWRFKAHR